MLPARARQHANWPFYLAGLSVLALYSRLLRPDLVLVGRDAFRLHVPLRQYLVERLQLGELPLWFPFDGLGRPFVDTAVSAVFHPFTLLYLVVPASTAYKASVLFCLALATVGAAALAVRLGTSRPGAALAAVAFSASGYMASLTDNVLYLFSAAAMPLFLFAVDRGFNAERRWWVIAALLWAAVLLDGDPHGAYLYGLLAGAWGLRSDRHRLLQRISAVAAMACLTLLLAAVQALPLFTAFSNSSRASDEFGRAVEKWATPPARLLEMAIAPLSDEQSRGSVARDIFGSPTPDFWARSLYLGLPVLAFALLGVKQRRGRMLAVFALTCLILALGEQGLLYRGASHLLPFWSAFRYPEKLMALASLFLALLAGLGLDEALQAHLRWPALAVGLLLLGSAGLAFWLGHGSSAGDAAKEAFLASTRSALFWSALAGSATLVALATRAFGLLRPSLACAALLAVVGADLGRVNSEAYRTGDESVAEFSPPLLDALRAREGPDSLGRFRLVTLREEKAAFPRRLGEAMGADAEVVYVRNALDEEHNASFGLESPAAYLPGESAALKAMLMDSVSLGKLAHFNVKYIVGAASQMERRGLQRHVVAELPSYDLALVENPVPHQPRAFAPRELLLVPTGSDWRRLVQTADFEQGRGDFVETDVPEETVRQQACSVAVSSYTPEHVSLGVHAETPCHVILSDAYYPGWTAVLDEGRELPIRRANALVRAVEVPVGEHVLEFRYRPSNVPIGAAISILTLASLLAGTGLALMRRKGHSG